MNDWWTEHRVIGWVLIEHYRYRKVYGPYRWRWRAWLAHYVC